MLTTTRIASNAMENNEARIFPVIFRAVAASATLTSSVKSKNTVSDDRDPMVLNPEVDSTGKPAIVKKVLSHPNAPRMAMMPASVPDSAKTQRSRRREEFLEKDAAARKPRRIAAPIVANESTEPLPNPIRERYLSCEKRNDKNTTIATTHELKIFGASDRVSDSWRNPRKSHAARAKTATPSSSACLLNSKASGVHGNHRSGITKTIKKTSHSGRRPTKEVMIFILLCFYSIH